MIEWPELDELKQVLDVDPQTVAWDGAEDSGLSPTRLSRLLAAAIAHVKAEVGNWNEIIDTPDEGLAAAALRMAELMALKPEVAAAVAGSGVTAAAVAGDPVYRAYMYGKHRRFGFS